MSFDFNKTTNRPGAYGAGADGNALIFQEQILLRDLGK
jgi:hypothetical protein